MTFGSGRMGLLRRLAVLAVLVIDGALFVAPASHSYVLWYADSYVYMFRETNYECDLFGEGIRALPWLPFFGHATGDMYWLPQWECSPYDPIRWGLFAQLVTIGVCYVLGRPREKQAELRSAFACLQTLATAMLVLCCARGPFLLGLLPLLLAVSLWRAPAAWRRIVMASAAFAVVTELVYVLVHFPNPRKWTWGLSLYLLDPEALLLPQLAGTVWFLRAPATGFDIGRVAFPLTVAAAALAAASAVIGWVVWPPEDYSFNPRGVLWIGVALLLAAIPLIGRDGLPRQRSQA